MKKQAVCKNCGNPIFWASERPEEGWPYFWGHTPGYGQRTGPARCPVFAEPVEEAD